MYESTTTIDGRKHFARQYTKWMDAFMDAVDTIGTCKRRSFTRPGPKVEVVIKHVFTGTIAATYNCEDDWDFR